MSVVSSQWSVVQNVQAVQSFASGELVQPVEIVKTVQTDFLSSLVCLLTSDL